MKTSSRAVDIFNACIQKANAIAVSMVIEWYDVSEVPRITEGMDDDAIVIGSLSTGVAITAGDIRSAEVQTATLKLKDGSVLGFLMEIPFEV